MDWPFKVAGLPPRSVISSIGPGSLLAEYIAATGLAGGTAVWPLGNTGIYVPVQVDMPCLVTKMGIQVATQSGNVDVGIYNEEGARLVSAGSTLVGVAGLQTFDIADTWLTPGVYFFAMVVSNTTGAFLRVTPANNSARAIGVQSQAIGSTVLPATATFAAPGNTYVPEIIASIGAVL